MLAAFVYDLTSVQDRLFQAAMEASQEPYKSQQSSRKREHAPPQQTTSVGGRVNDTRPRL